VDLRGKLYPPKSFNDAIAFGRSPAVAAGYVAAEDIVKNLSDEQLANYKLPPWSLTWPGGQMTAIGRTGRFVDNIKRWEKAFYERFDSATTNPMQRQQQQPLQVRVNSANSVKRRGAERPSRGVLFGALAIA